MFEEKVQKVIAAARQKKEDDEKHLSHQEKKLRKGTHNSNKIFKKGRSKVLKFKH